MASKYIRGSQISCMEELVKQNVVFFHEKALHRSFFLSWQIRYALVQIEKGTLFRADERYDAKKCWNQRAAGSDYEKGFWGTEDSHE